MATASTDDSCPRVRNLWEDAYPVKMDERMFVGRRHQFVVTPDTDGRTLVYNPFEKNYSGYYEGGRFHECPREAGPIVHKEYERISEPPRCPVMKAKFSVCSFRNLPKQLPASVQRFGVIRGYILELFAAGCAHDRLIAHIPIANSSLQENDLLVLDAGEILFDAHQLIKGCMSTFLNIGLTMRAAILVHDECGRPHHWYQPLVAKGQLLLDLPTFVCLGATPISFVPMCFNSDGAEMLFPTVEVACSENRQLCSFMEYCVELVPDGVWHRSRYVSEFILNPYLRDVGPKVAEKSKLTSQILRMCEQENWLLMSPPADNSCFYWAFGHQHWLRHQKRDNKKEARENPTAIIQHNEILRYEVAKFVFEHFLKDAFLPTLFDNPALAEFYQNSPAALSREIPAAHHPDKEQFWATFKKRVRDPKFWGNIDVDTFILASIYKTSLRFLQFHPLAEDPIVMDDILPLTVKERGEVNPLPSQTVNMSIIDEHFYSHIDKHSYETARMRHLNEMFVKRVNWFAVKGAARIRKLFERDQAHGMHPLREEPPKAAQHSRSYLRLPSERRHSVSEPTEHFVPFSPRSRARELKRPESDTEDFPCAGVDSPVVKTRRRHHSSKRR